VLLMTTLNDDGSSNISPLSSFWALGNRVVLGLGTQGQGYRNLQLRNECVLNFPHPPRPHRSRPSRARPA
jgi:flavin reductase (DIM6/NTAB) family NADH-FMN oxidoreductase RutF